ncbi:MAG: cytochrome-c peroxidase [Bacteroidetes bacterium RIFCSPLOWO2_12_FULL_35_15]|nr:MAG: cytochrome-c peroxidase [Bacteroidetes bacterium RIFCSPLOWO2_12_FULL_35_15]
MKQIFSISLFTFVLFVACNTSTNKATETEASAKQQSDKELHAKALGIFQALPNLAENAKNPVTPEKVQLGKMLYFDTRLSKTGNNSCNSCHNLDTYGVDNLPTSKGDAGNFGSRNSPTVLNAAFHVAQFWDGRAKDVEEQAGGPIMNPIEMGTPSKDFLVKKLKKVKEYNELFKAAFPSDKDPLTYQNIQNSIASFERTLITPSPFDKYLSGDSAALTTNEKEGLKTFIDVGCFQCHMGVGIGGALFQKFGIYGDYRTFTHSKINDEGKKTLTNIESDKDVFKAPSLRNVEKTFPYFHDGSVNDLKQAVIIMGKAQLNKDLSEIEVSKIVSFLNSLTGIVPADAKEHPKLLTQK